MEIHEDIYKQIKESIETIVLDRTLPLGPSASIEILELLRGKLKDNLDTIFDNLCSFILQDWQEHKPWK